MAGHEKVLANNLAAVRQRMAEAAQRSSRPADDVALVAVTKYVDADIARCLVNAGCRTLGENRPQSLWQKAEALDDLPVEWHMIGHLQRNKIRRTLPWISCLHSADSVRLLDGLQQEAQRADRRLQVLLEVNISGDADKTGLMPAEMLPLAQQLDKWDPLVICGLMAMSGLESDLEEARREFVQVRELRDRMQRECPDGVTLAHLSMGMSRDYQIAIEEGATMVRVGSALFEGVVG